MLRIALMFLLLLCGEWETDPGGEDPLREQLAQEGAASTPPRWLELQGGATRPGSLCPLTAGSAPILPYIPCYVFSSSLPARPVTGCRSRKREWHHIPCLPTGPPAIRPKAALSVPWGPYIPFFSLLSIHKDPDYRTAPLGAVQPPPPPLASLPPSSSRS